VQSLGEKAILGHSQRLIKLAGALSCIQKGPKCIQSLWDQPKKYPSCAIAQRKARYVRPLGKKPHFGAFPEAKKANWRSPLHAQRSKCIHYLWDHPKKIPFMQKNKKGAICAILREKKPILGHSQRLKKVFLNAQGCAMPRRGPIIMQVPRGYQKKSLLCRKSVIFSIRWKFQF